MFRRSPAFDLLIEFFFHRWPHRLLILLFSLSTAFFGLLAPFFQKEFVDGLSNNPSDLHLFWADAPFELTPLLAIGLSFVCVFLSLGSNILTNYFGVKEALVMQRRLAQRVYEHVLKLRGDSLNGRAMGEFVSIYATDIPGSTVFLDQSLPQGAGILFPFLLAPWMIGTLFQIPLWPLMILIGAIILTSLYMAYHQSVYFFRFKKLAADRIGLVNEWIQNIRILRILGWTQAFEEKIFKVRQVETTNRVRMVTNGQAMNSINSSVTFFLNIVAIVTLLTMSTAPITTGSLLALLWIVAVFLTRPFRMLPWFFTFVFDSWTSLKRVSEVLSLQNQEAHIRPPDLIKLKTLGAPDPAISIKNLNLALGGNALLKQISFEVKSGEFITIVGEVGSGKTLLLLSLLGESGASFGQYRIGDNDALQMPLDQMRQFFTFVPQEGFIMSASLRENVAFEYGVSPKKVDEQVLLSLRHAQFNIQTERIETGLDTEIGERGVNLSGGQKQRVSLARVDYFQAPVLLLDDCLSAVDVDTENKLIDVLIKGEWKNRTRLLVTHRLTVLEKSDRVIFLRDGAIADIGPFHELLGRNDDFRKFAATVFEDESRRNLEVKKAEQSATEILAAKSSDLSQDGEG